MEMFSVIKNQPEDVKCPACSIHKRILLKDLMFRRTVVCQSCETKIKLIDKDSSTSRVRREMTFDNVYLCLYNFFQV
jgi:uncharacterized protein with PIN domain